MTYSNMFQDNCDWMEFLEEQKLPTIHTIHSDTKMEEFIKFFKKNPEIFNEVQTQLRTDKINKIKERIKK